MYTGLVLLGSTIGTGVVYGATTQVPAIRSVFHMSTDGQPTVSGTMLTYQGQSYLPANVVIQQLRAAGLGAGWAGSTFNVTANTSHTQLQVEDNAASSAFNTLVDDSKSVDLKNTAQLSTYETMIYHDIDLAKKDLITTSEWRVHEPLDVQLKEAWLELFSQEIVLLNSFDHQLTDLVNGDFSASGTMYKEQLGLVDVANSDLKQVDNLESLEGWGASTNN